MAWRTSGTTSAVGDRKVEYIKAVAIDTVTIAKRPGALAALVSAEWCGEFQVTTLGICEKSRAWSGAPSAPCGEEDPMKRHANRDRNVRLRASRLPCRKWARGGKGEPPREVSCTPEQLPAWPSVFISTLWHCEERDRGAVFWRLNVELKQLVRTHVRSRSDKCILQSAVTEREL